MKLCVLMRLRTQSIMDVYRALWMRVFGVCVCVCVGAVEYSVALRKQRERASRIVRGMSSSVYTGLAR